MYACLYKNIHACPIILLLSKDLKLLSLLIIYSISGKMIALSEVQSLIEVLEHCTVIKEFT